MERKTKVLAEEGRQDLVITRDFDLPLNLLFRAYTESELLAQWMGTRVLKLENRRHGSYEFETCNKDGEVVFRAHGAIHEFEQERRIIRTFEMERAPSGVQIEFLEFEPLTEHRSRLRIQVVYRSAAHREEQLKLPFAWGINQAHDRLEQVLAALP